MPEITDSRAIIGGFAALIGILSYIPYLRDITAGKTKPHAFSWFIWMLLTAIGFAGQLSDSAGPGSWVTGVTAVLCGVIFLAALFRGDKEITQGDWLCLFFSFIAIPLWLVTKTPLWSMILITVIDAVGYIPTFRKTYHKPHEETLSTYTVSGFKFALALFALERFTVVTVLYPASLVVMNGIFVFMGYSRRKTLS